MRPNATNDTKTLIITTFVSTNTHQMIRSSGAVDSEADCFSAWKLMKKILAKTETNSELTLYSEKVMTMLH